MYKRTPATEKHHNEAGFVIDLCQARAARFVTDLTDNWGAEYVNRKDTCMGAHISDSSLVVLSGPFKHMVNKEPTIAPSNYHSCGGPYFCTLDDVGGGSVEVWDFRLALRSKQALKYLGRCRPRSEPQDLETFQNTNTRPGGFEYVLPIPFLPCPPSLPLFSFSPVSPSVSRRSNFIMVSQ